MTRSDLRASLKVKSSRGAPNSDVAAQGGGAAYNEPFYGPGGPLAINRGIVFPYTPNINVAHQVEYSQYDLVHTNYQQNSFSKTRNPNIQVTGQFVATTPAEARYMAAAMHFLRVTSKMNFGNRDADAGTPPPVLEFSAYGTYNFHRVPVLVGSFNFTYEDGVDYVEVETAGETIQLPAIMTIAMDLLPQYSPAKQNNFSLAEFARGADGYRRGFI